MNATNYYVSTSRVVLQGDPEAAQTWQVRQPGTKQLVLISMFSNTHFINVDGVGSVPHAAHPAQLPVVHGVRVPAGGALHPRGHRLRAPRLQGDH